MPQRTPTPLALQWAVFIRDHGTDLKLTKEARVLALALLTYGEGKKIYATMVTLSKVTGMKRETVRNARQELEDKGLLEDITGKPKSEKQERTYRLALPGYVEDASAGRLQVVPERTTRGPLEDHPVVPERITRGPLEDHNIKLLDQDLDQAQHHQADGVAERTQPQSQTPGGKPPRPPRSRAGLPRLRTPWLHLVMRTGLSPSTGTTRTTAEPWLRSLVSPWLPSASRSAPGLRASTRRPTSFRSSTPLVTLPTRRTRSGTSRRSCPVTTQSSGPLARRGSSASTRGCLRWISRP